MMFLMGATVAGRKVRYIKIGTKNTSEQALHLSKVELYGK